MIAGILQGLINGTEQLVWDREITAGEGAQASVSTGNILNGDEDGWYTVIGFCATGGGDIALRPNGDATSSNYGNRTLYGTSTSIANATIGTTGMYCGSIRTNMVQLFVTRLYAKSGAYRYATNIETEDISGNSVGYIETSGNVWINTTDNITSFTIAASAQFGVGSRFFIIKSNNFTSGIPTGRITTPYIRNAWVRLPGSGVLTTNTSSHQFSGLDGNRDVMYYLSYSMKSASASATDYTLRLNNDSTSAIYGGQLIAASDTTASAARFTGTNMGSNRSGYESGYMGQIAHLIYAKTGFVRPALSTMVDKLLGGTVTNLQLVGHVYNQTSNNITTIDLASTVANGFGVGSRFDLYALRPNG